METSSHRLETFFLNYSTPDDAASGCCRGRFKRLRFSRPLLWGAAVGLALLLLHSMPSHAASAPAQPTPSATQFKDSDLPPGYPSLDAPWTSDKVKAEAPNAPAPKPVEQPASAAKAAAPPPDQAQPGTATAAPAPELTPAFQPRIRKNEISVSGDYFLGQGNVTLPFGFALANALNAEFPNLNPQLSGTVNSADRSSDYYGATLSYSYGQAWYLDLTYAHGSSSGQVPVSLSQSGIYETLNSNFSIKDDYYQAYIRYAFPGLRGKRLSAYLRAGVSYVKATLDDQAPIPNFGTYSETDNTKDLLGNLGFGVGYALYASRHWRVGLQAEGEGFFGRRTQDIQEVLYNNFGLGPLSTSIDNNLYGGIGRGTVRAEYRIGSSGAFKIFADGGLQAKYTFIKYSGVGTFHELLWGPYAKIGVRYAF